MAINYKSLLATRAGGGDPFIFPGPETPIVFNFDQGLAAPETFPIQDLIRLSDAMLNRDGSDVLDYFDPDVGYEELVFGSRRLRIALSERYQAVHGRNLSPEQFILTSGSVQAISLAMSALLNEGDVVLVEAATFPYAMNYMRDAGAEIWSVPVDEDGMDTGSVEVLLEKAKNEGKRIKLVYTISTFQMPTGTVLSLPRRKHLLTLSETHDFIILEDYVYGELRYEGDPLPSLLSLDTAGRVIHDNSFSKTLAPGLRIGWMTGPQDLINALAAVRQDLGVSQWMARLAQEFLDAGLYDDHLARANALYKDKRDATVRAVRKYCADYLTFTVPKGSFYLWAEVNQSVDWVKAAELAAVEGIYFRPGERFDLARDNRQFIRLAFARVSFEVIDAGVRKLGEILKVCERQVA